PHLSAEKFDVIPGRAREIGPPADGADVRGPAGEGFIDRAASLEIGQRGGQLGDPAAVELVGDGDPELVKAAEDVEEHDRQLGRAADPRGVADGDGVEPAAAAGSAREPPPPPSPPPAPPPPRAG